MNRFCTFCMSPMTDAPTCPVCGLDPATYVSAVHHLPVGTVLKDRYLIGRALGEGGFGVTYIGRDLNLDCKVAIKEYFPKDKASRNTSTMRIESHSGDEENSDFAQGKERFRKEARAIAMLEKDKVAVGVRDFIEDNNTAYIIMEYIEGTTLSKIAELRGGRMQPEELFRLIEPLFAALDDFHGHGLVHRDISPDNIMLERGKVRLLDFGCAKDVSASGQETTSVALKHDYAPVELYTATGHGAWSDIYSLGATIYRCLTGNPPPRAFDRMISDTIVPPRQLGVQISENCERALMKSLSLKSADRQQTAGELKAGLYADPFVPAAMPAAGPDSNVVPETAAQPQIQFSTVQQTSPIQFAAPAAQPADDDHTVLISPEEQKAYESRISDSGLAFDAENGDLVVAEEGSRVNIGSEPSEDIYVGHKGSAPAAGSFVQNVIDAAQQPSRSRNAQLPSAEDIPDKVELSMFDRMPKAETSEDIYEQIPQRSSRPEQLPSADRIPENVALSMFDRMPQMNNDPFGQPAVQKNTAQQFEQFPDLDKIPEYKVERNTSQENIFGQIPQSQYGQVQQSQYGQVPQSQYGQVPQSQYGQVPQSQYGQMQQSQYGQMQQPQYGQTPQTDNTATRVIPAAGIREAASGTNISAPAAAPAAAVPANKGGGKKKGIIIGVSAAAAAALILTAILLNKRGDGQVPVETSADITTGTAEITTVTTAEFTTTTYADEDLDIEITDADLFETVEEDGRITITKYLGTSGEVSIPAAINGKPVTKLQGDTGMSIFPDPSLITAVDLPSGLREIGTAAFFGCTNLGYVAIPNSVSVIGERAFYECSSMRSVRIPAGVSEISSFAFYGCKEIKSVTLPGSVTAVGDHAFGRCSSMMSVKFTSSVTSIGEQAFEDCTALEAIKLPKSISRVGKSAFKNCSKAKILILSSGMSMVDTETFNGCSSLEKLVVPNSIMRLNGKSFMGCTSLGDVSLPTDCSVADDAFSGCDAANIMFRSMGEEAVTEEDPDLMEVPVPDTEPEEEDVPDEDTTQPPEITTAAPATAPDVTTKTPDVTTAPPRTTKTTTTTKKDTTTTKKDDKPASAEDTLKYVSVTGGVEITGYRGTGGKLVIPSKLGGKSVISIAASAFSSNSVLESVEIPSSVTNIGENAFRNCTSLTSVTMKATPKELSAYCFAGCTKLREISLPEGIREVHDCAFQNCTGLTKVTTPESMWYIDNNVFEGCSSLTSLNMKEGNKTIGDSCFKGCTSLSVLNVPKSTEKIGAHAFENDISLSDITLSTKMKKISPYTFAGCTGLRKIDIPRGPEIFEECAFYKCTNLETVSLNDSLGVIGTKAFSGCGKLSSINFPNSIQEIGAEAFSECKGLTRLDLPTSLKTIGDDSFALCENVTSVTFPSGLTSIGSSAFIRCYSITSIDIPSTVKTIGSYAFQNCTSLSKLTLGEGVKVIDEYAFSKTAIVELDIPHSIEKIGFAAFWDCSKLKYVYMSQNTDIDIDAFINTDVEVVFT